MNKDYKAMAEDLREQRIRGANRAVVRQGASAKPEKKEVSDKAAKLIATALKDLLH